MNSASDGLRTGAAGPIQITLVDDFSSLAHRRGDWNALVERSHTSTVFQTYEFHASWWAVFGSGSRLLVLLAEREGALVAIAPLMISERRIFGRVHRTIQFIGARSFDYCDFIVERGSEAALPLLLARLTAGSGDFDSLYLRDIPDTSPTVDTLRTFCDQQSLPSDVRVLYEAPTRLFNDPVADRQLPNKKSLKRHYNYFKRSGKLELRHCHTADEVAPFLERFFAQHIARRAVTDTPSVFVDTRMQQFFRTLALALSPQGWLLFSIVLYNDQPIAMHFGFEYGGRIIWYKPAFEMDLAKHSPGEVLIKGLIEYALERQARELDFTIGEEAFKYRFANHTRKNYAVRAYRKWTSYRVGRLMLDARAFIERFPAVSRLARKALARWRAEPWL